MGSSNDQLEVYGTYLAKFFIVFGGVIPYIPQYLDITKTGDASGFSTLVCFVLILANTLRIVYWFGHHFDEALLFQSIVIIIAMFVMLELCIRMNKLRAESQGIILDQVTFFHFRWSLFWQWTDFHSYFEATFCIALLANVFLFFFKAIPYAVDGIGYAALLIEACLALPQFVKNFKTRSVHGMNVMMVFLWAIGDAFKGFYSVWKNQPLPFIICASIQLGVDFAIFGEILVF